MLISSHCRASLLVPTVVLALSAPAFLMMVSNYGVKAFADDLQYHPQCTPVGPYQPALADKMLALRDRVGLKPPSS